MLPARFVHRSCVVIAYLAACGAGSACVTSPMAPTRYAPYSQSDLRVGTGSTVTTGSVVTVHYTGWFYDETRPDSKGAVFESSLAGTPLELQVGSSGVIFAWNQGLPGMQVGGVRRLIVPPSVGYGGFRTGPIPPYTTLVFEIEVLALLE